MTVLRPQRRFRLGFGIALAASAVLASHPPIDRQRAALPAQLSDREFWQLTETLSEPGGAFVSDNLVSNEAGFQKVLPALAERHPAGGVYLGVGPEQNFTYIAALRPRIAFIVDIRRGNRDLHLMYKAIFELARDRAEFLSLLFSRAQPERLTATSTAAEIFFEFDRAQPTESAYRANLARLIDLLTTSHQWPLSADELRGIEYVYGQFYRWGPALTYSQSSGLRSVPLTSAPIPSAMSLVSGTYRSLMQATDANDEEASFLSSEERFAIVRSLELRNLVVPIVGNFAGPSALSGIGDWLRARGAIVSAFYTSNVEDYLRRSDIWNAFCENVVTLPADAASEFIFSGSGGPVITPPLPPPSFEPSPAVKFEPGPEPKTVIVLLASNGTRILFVNETSPEMAAAEAAKVAATTHVVIPPNRVASILEATKPCR
jgi:hypothetical protein